MPRYLPALALFLLVGCVAQSSGGGGGGTPEPVFNLPAEGSLVNTVTLFSVTGSNVANVEFIVDGQIRLIDAEAPFEWTFDPADYLIGMRTLEVTAGLNPGGVRRVVRNVTVDRAVPLQDIKDAVANLPGGEWYEVPNSRLRAAAWTMGFQPTGGGIFAGSFSNIISAASGGAFDTKRDRLIVWGGGSDWPGNDVYAFDLATYRWTRVVDPSPIGDGANGSVTYPDGRPAARHSYDYVEYIPPPIDRFFVGGGGALWTGQVLDSNTWLFDFDALEWEQHPATTEASIGAISALDGNGRVWQVGESGQGLSMYDPVADTWTTHSAAPATLGQVRTAEIDPMRNIFLGVGRNTTMAWDLDNPDDPPADLATTGDREIEDVPNPGVAYHPPSDRIVAWGGGKSVYVLNGDTLVWTRVDSAGSVDPGPQATRGTYGRWRYVPSLDVFIVVNSTETNVFIYRLP